MYYAGCQYEGMNCALSVSLWPDCLRARPGHSIKRWDETPLSFHCRGNRCMPLHDSVLLLCMMTCPIPEMRCLPSRNLRTLTNAWCHVFVCFIISMHSLEQLFMHVLQTGDAPPWTCLYSGASYVHESNLRYAFGSRTIASSICSQKYSLHLHHVFVHGSSELDDLRIIINP